jgi:hypothetical protein
VEQGNAPDNLAQRFSHFVVDDDFRSGRRGAGAPALSLDFSACEERFKREPCDGVTPENVSSTANYYERRGRIPAFAGVAIYSYAAVVGEAASTEHAQIARVSPDFFATLGTGVSIGEAA